MLVLCFAPVTGLQIFAEPFDPAGVLDVVCDSAIHRSQLSFNDSVLPVRKDAHLFSFVVHFGWGAGPFLNVTK